jgi:hypothetical protein
MSGELVKTESPLNILDILPRYGQQLSLLVVVTDVELVVDIP